MRSSSTEMNTNRYQNSLAIVDGRGYVFAVYPLCCLKCATPQTNRLQNSFISLHRTRMLNDDRITKVSAGPRLPSKLFNHLFIMLVYESHETYSANTLGN